MSKVKLYIGGYDENKDQFLLIIRKIDTHQYLGIQINSIFDQEACKFNYDTNLEIIGSPILFNIETSRYSNPKYKYTTQEHRYARRTWCLYDSIKISKIQMKVFTELPVLDKKAKQAIGEYNENEDPEYIDSQEATMKDNKMKEEGWQLFVTSDKWRIESTIEDYTKQCLSRYIKADIEKLPLIQNDRSRYWRVILHNHDDIDEFLLQLSNYYTKTEYPERFEKYSGCYYWRKQQVEEQMF